jgi:hypothetical protein
MLSDKTLIAHLALIAIIPLTWLAFQKRRPAMAALWVIFGSILYGPEGAYFKFPAIPELSKQSIPFICVIVAVWLRDPNTIRAARPFRGMDLLVIIPIVMGPFTALTNMDPLQFGIIERTNLPAMSFKDGISLGLTAVTEIWMPFFCGRMLFRSGRDLRDLMKFLAWAAILYSPFMLYEGRFSPQLHGMLYGYKAHIDFAQTIRWGGYRPMVFMEHGLAVALFMFVAWGSATVLAREKLNIGRFKARTVALFLGVMVIFSKSTGAIGFVILCVLPLAKLRPRPVLMGAAISATIVMLYPLLRATDIFPTMELYEFFATNVNQERADSILFRFVNEDMLLERARERPYFGWGYYGRNRVYDSLTGRDISVTDGYWIIILGARGAIATIAAFAAMLAPAYYALARIRRVPKSEQTLIAGFSLIVVVTVVDLVPNGLFSVYPYFLAGALWGCLNGVIAARR